jgi:hypothetical protein
MKGPCGVDISLEVALDALKKANQVRLLHKLAKQALPINWS